MKNQRQNEKLAQCQIWNILNGACKRVVQSTKKLVLQNDMNPVYPNGKFLVGKRGEGGELCKGPPGNSSNPAKFPEHPPDNQSNKIISINDKYLQNNKNDKSNSNHNINSKIMKKQILFLAFLVMATFANVLKSYGQCLPTALTPAAGVSYPYSTALAGTGATYNWYVTQNVDVFTSANIIDATTTTFFTVGTPNQYNSTANGQAIINITWTTAAIANGNPFYVVLRYTETTSGTAGCSVENIRVVEIKPINTFLLAFEGGMISSGNYTATPGSNVCAAPLTGATVIPGSPSTTTLVFGNNTLYYVATASGINGDWYPQIQLPALLGTQTYVSAEWSSDMTGGGTFNAIGTIATTGDTQDLLSTTPAATAVAGTPILIKIVINNHNWQSVADQGILVGLDGFLPPTPIVVSGVDASESDIDVITCLPLAAFGRTATVTVNKRPEPGPGVPVFLLPTNP